MMLPVGDYSLAGFTESVAIERERRGDFVASRPSRRTGATWPANTIEPISGGRDRGRTCDIRYVKPALCR